MVVGLEYILNFGKIHEPEQIEPLLVSVVLLCSFVSINRRIINASHELTPLALSLTQIIINLCYLNSGNDGAALPVRLHDACR